MTLPLTPHIWSPSQRQWSLVEDTPSSLYQEQLTVATYNVWFGESYLMDRAHGLLGILQSHQPDVIGLQEVTPSFLKVVLHTDWIRENYWVSELTGDILYGYGVLLLSKLPASHVTLYDLPSQMGRRLLYADFRINDGVTRVATVHLESLEERQRRLQQLALSFLYLEDADHAVLMGDFNFDVSHEENKAIDTRYQDVWAVVHPQDAGHTKDSTINTMKWHSSGKADHVRYDRVLLRSVQWQPTQCQRLGMTPLHPSTPHIFPSDHFGLLSHFQWCP